MAQRADKTGNKRLIIHCGVQKTGSTAFHHFVARNCAQLADHVQVLTPEKGSAMRDVGRAAMRFSLDPDEASKQDLCDSLQILRNQVDDLSGTVVLSHENLPGAMIGKGGVVTLYPQLEQILTLVRDVFAPLETEFVAYTRRMPDWKTSVYNQAVKSDHLAAPFANFQRDTAACGSWDQLEQRMQTLLGDASVSVFQLENEPDASRPGQQLLRHAGVPQDVLASLAPLRGRSNVSLNAGALEFLRQVNGLDLPRPARTEVARLVASNQSLFVAERA